MEEKNKSPDEWATTKQACRNELVVYLFFSSIYIYIYIYIYNIKWWKVKQAQSYSNISKRCNLCLWEKYFIIYKPDMSTLNNRSELISNCRHSKKFLLKNVLA